jgi:hypothetical protein
MADRNPVDVRALLHELNRRVLENPSQTRRIIQDFYDEQVRAGNTEAADEVLILRSIVLARGGSLTAGANSWMRRSLQSRFWRFAAVAVGVLVLAGAGYSLFAGRVERAANSGPHPEFWAKLPQAGQNNVWYSDQNPDTVFVFVHGVFSDSRGCWSNEHGIQSQYWPELVLEDNRLERPSVYLGGYATSVDGGPYDARQAAGELRDGLKREGVLNRNRIVFVAHSLGGIVVRFLLVHNQELFRGKMLGLVLYASPSLGAALANHLAALSWFYGNKLTQQLQRENPFLTELDKDFRDLLYNPNSDPNHLRLVGAEGVENFFIVHRRFLPDTTVVVPEDSASRYFGAPVYLRGTDHFSIVKPETMAHPGHQLLLTFYQKFQKDLGRPGQAGLELAGRVVTADSQRTVAGATVSIEGQSGATTTDEDGNFSIQVQSNRASGVNLRVATDRYSTVVRYVVPPQKSMVIQLRRR